jgi:hypothetical protein
MTSSAVRRDEIPGDELERILRRLAERFVEFGTAVSTSQPIDFLVKAEVIGILDRAKALIGDQALDEIADYDTLGRYLVKKASEAESESAGDDRGLLSSGVDALRHLGDDLITPATSGETVMQHVRVLEMSCITLFQGGA